MASPFERLAATLDYPLYVITTAWDDEPAGCLIGFATQCSIHPPRFLACISKKNHTLLLAREAASVAVHVVEERDRAIAELFGGETGDEIDKFARVSWHSTARRYSTRASAGSSARCCGRSISATTSAFCSSRSIRHRMRQPSS